MSRVVRKPLVVGAAGAVATLLVWLLAYRVDPTRAADGRLYRAFYRRDTPAVDAVASLFTLWFNLLPYAALAAGVCLHALARRGLRGAVTIVAILLGANLVTQALKHLTAAPRPWSLTADGHVVDPVSWPSGHVTAVTALAVCAVLCAPPVRQRLVALVGGAWAVAVAVGVVLLGWHMPSDALGAFGVVAAVAGTTIGALRAVEARRPAGAQRHEDLGPPRVAVREPV